MLTVKKEYQRIKELEKIMQFRKYEKGEISILQTEKENTTQKHIKKKTGKEN